MKCRYCGGEIDSKSKTCPFCGSSISLEDKKELEQLNKKGCPKCGSTNIVFKREQAGVARSKKGTRTIYHTKGICNDCGYTWTTDTTKKSKIWLWVLGWIFIFPLPLTILLLRKKNMKPALKYGIIAGSWVVFLLFVIINNSGKNDTSEAKINQNTLTAQTAGNITKTEFNPLTKDIALDISKEYSSSDWNWVHCTVKDKNSFTYEDLVFVSENTDIVTFDYDSTAMDYIYYKAIGVSAGETYVYVATKDGTVFSEKIKVTVTGVKPTPTSTSTPVPTKEPTPTLDPNATPTPIPERMVWISSTGSKYHSNSSCSNMEDPKQVTEREAKELGYEPCGRCGG